MRLGAYNFTFSSPTIKVKLTQTGKKPSKKRIKLQHMSHLAALTKLLGPGASLISDPDITASYSRDQAPFAKSAPPFAVLLARSAEEIFNRPEIRQPREDLRGYTRSRKRAIWRGQCNRRLASYLARER
jgi:hypothetical protein